MSDQMPKFEFEVDTPLADDWKVAAIRGVEEMSRPWRYEVELYVHANDAKFSNDIGSLPGKEATLKIERDGQDGQSCELKGMVAEFHYLGATTGGWEIHRYRAVLVPYLWLAGLRRQSRILATSEEKTDVELVIEGLTEADNLGADAVLASDKVSDSGMTGEPPARDFVMQYEETDLDFYHRRLEKCGVFYLFDDDGVITLCDDNVSIPVVDNGEELSFATHAGMTHSNRRIVTDVRVRDAMLPEKVALTERNYEQPKVDLFREKSVSDEGSGVWAADGEFYADQGAGDAIAALRAEESICRQRVLEAATPVLELRAGRVFTLSDHPDDDFNGDYVVVATEVRAARPGRERPDIPGAVDGYECRFRAIPKANKFRPARTTPIPRIAGMLSALVDGESDDEPNVDEDGRYRLRFLFDKSSSSDGSASAPVRRMQPFGGPSEGFHTPLRKGTEVMVGFVNGNVDRPVILGSVPDADHPSVVNNVNRGSSVIRTSSGVVLTIADF